MKLISTSIDIAAPPEQVWRVLTDFAAHPQWNPFIVSISGPLRPGAKLAIRIEPPGGKGMAFTPTVLVAKPDRELRWKGKLLVPGLFDGEHFFKLEPSATGTRFEHGERFSGLLVMLMGASAFDRIGQGFELMNEALKKRVEAAG